MTTILLTILLLLIIVAAMAVGVMFGREPIKGSCGGIAALTGERQCDLCGGDRLRCEEINRGASAEDASQPPAGKVEQFDPRAPR